MRIRIRNHRRAATAFALLITLAFTAIGCGSDGGTDPPSAHGTAPSGPCANDTLPSVDVHTRSFTAPERVLKANCDYRATITTNFGEISIALTPNAAPQTVNSFVFLATRGFYDGLTFHRVVPDFVIQGGDPDGTGVGGPGYTLPDELPAEPGYAPGAVAMANAGPNTAGSQFFIVTGDAASDLPNAYSQFGTVTDGLAVAQRIAGLADPADPQSQRPQEPVKITSIRIVERSPANRAKPID